MSPKPPTADDLVDEGWLETSFKVWKPKPGETLTGAYRGFVKVEEGINGPFNAHRIETLDSRIWSVSGAVIDNALRDVKDGTPVKITFDGKIDLDSGQKMNEYRVMVKK